MEGVASQVIVVSSPRVLSSMLAACSLVSVNACSGPSIASARPGSYLVVVDAADDTLSVVEPNSGHVRDRAPTGVGPRAVRVANDGSFAVVANHGDATPGHTLSVYDFAARRVVYTIDIAPHARPCAMEFVDRRTTLLVACESTGVLLQVDVLRRELKRAIELDEPADALALSADHARAFVANESSGRLHSIDLASGTIGNSMTVGARPCAIVRSPDGRELWIGHDQGQAITVLDANSLDKIGEIACGPRPSRIAFTLDGTRAVATIDAANEVALIDVRARSVVAYIAIASHAKPTASRAEVRASTSSLLGDVWVTPNDRYAFVAVPNEGRIVAIDLEKRSITGSVATGRTPVALAWSWIARPFQMLGDAADFDQF